MQHEKRSQPLGNFVIDSVSALIDDLLCAIPPALLSRIHSALDNHSDLRFGPRERRIGGQFGRKLNSIPDGHFYPVRDIHRNAFLWGSANFVRDKRREWMILGFGHTEGTRTCVDHVRKLPGGSHRVSVGPLDIAHIHSYLNETPAAAVIAVHNHPKFILADILAFLFGGEPMPSLIDRDSALDFYLLRLETAMAGSEFGRTKFFLIQHDEVKPFSGSTVGVLADWVRRMLPTILAAIKTLPNPPAYRE